MGPYVEGLSSYVVTSYDDIGTWLSVGNKRRATAATGMNDTSSRSHSVFSLLLTQTMVGLFFVFCLKVCETPGKLVLLPLFDFCRYKFLMCCNCLD